MACTAPRPARACSGPVLAAAALRISAYMVVHLFTLTQYCVDQCVAMVQPVDRRGYPFGGVWHFANRDKPGQRADGAARHGTGLASGVSLQEAMCSSLGHEYAMEFSLVAYSRYS